MTREPDAGCTCAENIDGLALNAASRIDGAILGTRMSRDWLCPAHGKEHASVAIHLRAQRRNRAKALAG